MTFSYTTPLPYSEDALSRDLILCGGTPCVLTDPTTRPKENSDVKRNDLDLSLGEALDDSERALRSRVACVYCYLLKNESLFDCIQKHCNNSSRTNHEISKKLDADVVTARELMTLCRLGRMSSYCP